VNHPAKHVRMKLAACHFTSFLGDNGTSQARAPSPPIRTERNDDPIEFAAMDAKFFRAAADFRRWLAKNSTSETELWVGYFKSGSGTPSVTWPESVDHALCYGWIDGIRKSIDETRYMIRFTPRKPNSTWSAVNIERVGVLRELGLMQLAGMAAFGARRANRSGIYSYEQRPADLPNQYAAVLKKRTRAYKFFSAQPPSYRKAAIWWVVSAKQEATRLRRLEQLINDSELERRIKQFVARPGVSSRPTRKPDTK
jgi:uncharacterized protein YdeI (YjbR/CyaY-like superfamily)